MDTKELSTFLVLARTLNYKAASDQLQYARSTLFNHIQMLEQELGTALFVKKGRQLELTEGGQAFLEYANRIMNEYQQTMEYFTAQKNEQGAITVAGCEVNVANSLFTLLDSFIVKYPKMNLRMIMSPNASVPEMIRNGLADVGYYYSLGQDKMDGIQCMSLYQERLYLLASPQNPLTAQEHVTYEALNGMMFVHPHDNCCFATELLDRMHRRGVSFQQASYVGAVQHVIDLAYHHNALMIIPEAALPAFKEKYGMVPVHLEEEPIWTWENVVYKNFETLNPGVKTLIRFSYNTMGQKPAS